MCPCRLDELVVQEASLRLKEQLLQQEKTLLKSQNEWLSSELQSKSEKLLSLRKEKASSVSGLEATLTQKQEEVCCTAVLWFIFCVWYAFPLSRLCVSLSRLCVSLSRLCVSLSRLCVSLSRLCVSLSRLCVSLSRLCVSLSRLCVRPGEAPLLSTGGSTQGLLWPGEQGRGVSEQESPGEGGDGHSGRALEKGTLSAGECAD